MNLTTMVVVFAAGMLGTIGLAIIAIATLVSAWLAFAVGARRLHDRNKSAWWLVAMYVPLLVLSTLGMIAAAASPDAGNGLNVLSLPFSIWVFVELGCLEGTAGPNRFGGDPLEPTPAEVFS